MAIKIRPVRGEIQAPTIRTGGSQLNRARRFAAADLKPMGAVVSDALQIYTKKQEQLDQQNRLNVVSEEEGKLQNSLIDLNQKIQQEYQTGNISEEQLNLIYDQEAEKTVKFYEQNLDPKTFSMFKGAIYRNFAQTKKEGLRYRENAIIGQADITYTDNKTRIFKDIQNTNSANMSIQEYESYKLRHEENIKNLSKVRRVDVNKELADFEFMYLRKGSEGLIPAPNGKNAQYYFDLADKLRISKGKQGYVSEIGGRELTDEYREILLSDIDSQALNLKKISDTREEVGIDNVSKQIINKIANEDAFTTDDPLFKQLNKYGTNGEAQSQALKQILVAKQTNTQPSSINVENFQEIVKRVSAPRGSFVEQMASIDNDFTKFTLKGETEEEAKSLTERIGSMSLNFEQSRVISSILERKKREQYAKEQADFERLYKTVEPKILGKLKDYNTNAPFRAISVRLKLEERFADGIKKGIKSSELTDPLHPEFIYRDIDADILTITQESEEVRKSLKRSPEQTSNVVGERKSFFPPDMGEWFANNPELIKNLNAEESINAYRNSKEYKSWQNYAPFQTQYKKFLEKMK
jgi:hypothetical protein